MTIPTHDVGDRRRLRFRFRDSAGAFADPTTVTFKMKEPDAVVTTYVYGVAAQLVKEAVGQYYVRWPIAKAGLHTWSAGGTGAVESYEERQFTARAKTIA
jgi:hypothetical protein